MEKQDMENKAPEVEKEEEQKEEIEIVVYGKSTVDGVAVSSKGLVNATEDYPIVLLHNVDFVPVKVGDEIKTPYDAVLPMDQIQIVGPMIRVIIKVEPMTNVEAI